MVSALSRGRRRTTVVLRSLNYGTSNETPLKKKKKKKANKQKPKLALITWNFISAHTFCTMWLRSVHTTPQWRCVAALM